MKNTRKILVALILVLAMIMSFAAVSAFAAEETEAETRTIYFTNNKGWSTINAYYWGTGSNPVSWPGVAMTKDSTNDYGQDIYSISIPANMENIIFSNGSEQTVDIKLNSTVNAYYLNEKNASGKWSVGTWTNNPDGCTHTPDGDATASIAPTCTVDGTNTFTCSKCGESYDEVVMAAGHKYENGKCTVCQGVPTFTVAGVAELCGTAWDTGNTDNDMTYDETAGTYTKVYDNLPAGTYSFKCVQDHDWNPSYGGVGETADKDGNYVVTLTGESSTLTITLKGDTISVKVEEYLEPDQPGTDEPGTDEPGTDEPGTDEPGTDEPGNDDPIDIPTVETITVFFENNWFWTEVYGYYWIGDSVNEAFPGAALPVVGTLDGHDVYAMTLPANVDGIIISGIKDDNSGMRDQTPDITEGIVDGAGWKMEWIDETNAVVAIEFDPSADDPTVDPDDPTVDPDDPTVDPVAPDYYLIGNINGANYGCEDDYENLGEYKFEDGKLVATFETDSYVFIKTGDNLNWFMTEGWLGTEASSATLYNTNVGLVEANKLYVPGGVEVTLTLVVNDNGTLTLSYETAGGNTDSGDNGSGEQTPPTFTIAGTGAHLGTEWDTENTANDMTYANGVYTKVYTNVKAGEYAFKCAKDHKWDVAYPAEDYKYTVAVDGSTVTITLDGETVTVEIDAPEAPKPGTGDNKPGTDDNKPGTDDNKPGTDDNKPGTDNNKPGDDNQPEQPEEELNFFQKIWKAIVDFFVSIGDFFKNLFSGNKK